MLQHEEKEHTSKPITASQFLPPLQKRILLALAGSRPMNKNETAHSISGHYKSTWVALDSLEKKGIITKINTDEWRGREYTRFWLTTAGVFVALVEGINPQVLLTKTLEIYPENKILQCVVELSTILGTDAYRIAYSAVLNKGKFEKTDAAEMLGSLMLKDLSSEQIEDLMSIINKYPEQFRDFKKQRDRMLKNLKKVEAFLKGFN
jgi:hypothetical protein